MIDALGEVHSHTDRVSIVQTIVDLAALPCVRVVVATRPLASGGRYTPGALLPDLQVTGPDSPNLVDLDDPAYFDRDALVGFAAALLGSLPQIFEIHPEQRELLGPAAPCTSTPPTPRRRRQRSG